MKIFATVGTQGHFDRLICALDNWVVGKSDVSVIAQIGKGARRPKNINFFETIEQSMFFNFVKDADVVVSHAGMGTIITAIELEKKIVVMPRLFKNAEHRNDHQVDTARHLSEKANIVVAYDESQLVKILDELSNYNKINYCFVSKDRERLISFIRDFVNL